MKPVGGHVPPSPLRSYLGIKGELVLLGNPPDDMLSVERNMVERTYLHAEPIA